MDTQGLSGTQSWLSVGRSAVERIAQAANRRRWLVTAVLAIVLGLSTWPIQRLTPVGGIDGSWQAAMVMAMEDGLRWGVDLIFTYGPLGFLSVPQLYSPILGAVAWAFIGLIHLAVCGVVIALSLRRESLGMGLLLAGIGALLVAPLQATTALVVLSMALATTLLLESQEVAKGQPRIVGVMTLGAIAALVLTIKFNDGVAAVAVLGAASIGLPRPGRHIVAGAATLTVATGALWVLSGQALLDFPQFLVLSAEVASGYSTAMGVEDPSRDWQYAAVAVGAVLVGATTWTQTRLWEARARIALGLMIAAAGFLAYKHGVVRHGGGGFFEMLALISVWILPWTRDARGHRVLLMAALILAAMGVSRAVPTRFLDVSGVGIAMEQATTIASSSQRSAAIESARRAMREAYEVPDALLEQVGNRTVHIEPFETGVAWAHPELRWRPLPTLQRYGAYTDTLDGLDASALASPAGPSVILSHMPATIDGRAPYLEAPSSTLETLCRYVEIAASDRWQVLERRGSRCGESRDLGSEVFAPGDLVDVPSDPGRIVVASIEGIESDVGSRIAALLSRSPIWQIGRTGIGFERLVPGRANGPLLMSIPAGLGWSERFVPRSTPSFTVITGSTLGVADEMQATELTVRFTSIAFDRR